jgi:hypothetical protein
MHLIQILLPLHDNEGQAFDEQLLRGVRRELLERYGGLTAYVRAPAEGVWQDDRATVHDEIVVVEVMAELDRAWWQAFRARLERDFRQDQILIRAQAVEQL